MYWFYKVVLSCESVELVFLRTVPNVATAHASCASREVPTNLKVFLRGL